MLDLLVYLQKMADEKLKALIITATAIFMIAPIFILLYILLYNRRKKKYAEEKQQMQLTFEDEILRTQMEIQEQTMQTIGADLHDNIGQLLSLTALTLESIELNETEKARGKIISAIRLTTVSIEELRRLGKLIQGERLTALGLKEAIEQEISWLETSGRFKVTFHFNETLRGRGNNDTDLILFRIFQEIVSNIIKHAGAGSINIDCGDDNGQLILRVTDNGCGFDTDNLNKNNNGLGIFNIRKRVSILGGEVNIVSAKSRGTSTEIHIPY